MVTFSPAIFPLGRIFSPVLRCIQNQQAINTPLKLPQAHSLPIQNQQVIRTPLQFPIGCIVPVQNKLVINTSSLIPQLPNIQLPIHIAAYPKNPILNSQVKLSQL